MVFGGNVIGDYVKDNISVSNRLYLFKLSTTTITELKMYISSLFFVHGVFGFIKGASFVHFLVVF
jgi:hypothetical protein